MYICVHIYTYKHVHTHTHISRAVIDLEPLRRPHLAPPLGGCCQDPELAVSPGRISRTREVALPAFPSPERVRTPTLLGVFLRSQFLPARLGAEDPAIEGRLGSARHALGAEPSQPRPSGPGRRPESLGTALLSRSPRVAGDSTAAFGAISHRGQ